MQRAPTRLSAGTGTTPGTTTGTTTDPQSDELIDAVLGASRALVAVAARSLATVADDVTLAQYRVLIELASRGPQRLADLAAALRVDRSTATRMCDRLVRKRLVTRRRTSEDRRGVRISLTRAGAGLVADVSCSRREEIGAVVARMPSPHRPLVVEALHAFAQAAGEVPEQDWSLGWHLGHDEPGDAPGHDDLGHDGPGVADPADDSDEEEPGHGR